MVCSSRSELRSGEVASESQGEATLLPYRPGVVVVVVVVVPFLCFLFFCVGASGIRSGAGESVGESRKFLFWEQ